MIEVRNVDFAYKESLVIKSINNQLSQGDFVCVVGPNGSGKSTLIKCLAGILRPKSGSILLNKRNVHTYHHRELAKTIAYVPQAEYNLHPVNVFDAVLMGRKPYFNWSPGNKDYIAVQKALELMALGDNALDWLNELSGGQRQRVFIARALAQEANVLLMDEPTANLDIRHALDVMQILRDLAGKGITVIIAIHDLNLAARYCSKMLMLNEGYLFSSGGREIMTAENIKKMYNIDVQIREESGQLFFIPQ